MTGAEYIAEFLLQRGTDKIFLVTGGACAFIVDAIGRNPKLSYVCFHHEQSAAMAADSLWRVDRRVGATVVTSGPGATNLITGIACSYFDSIPTIHITGQVNQNEKTNYKGANVRQAGFQETKIVDMVKPITKYAVAVTTGEELKRELTKAYNLATTGRMGPVVIDVPMDVQKEDVGDVIEYTPPQQESVSSSEIQTARQSLEKFFAGAERPLILVGAGVGLSGAEKATFAWIESTGIPFVSSWNGMTYFNHDTKNYCGHIGVYGNRGSNFLVQNCDRLLVLGSRLDNRQRSGATDSFALSAKTFVIDVDAEEIKKYKNNKSVEGFVLNLSQFPKVTEALCPSAGSPDWIAYVKSMKERYFGQYPSTSADNYQTLSPYAAVQRINGLIQKDAVVVADDGANLCWVFQAFHRTEQSFYTAGGNSPMGYAFPAAIGASLYFPKKQVIAFTGDGSMQMNMQELQTVDFHKLNMKLFILNNFGYGIIKQFQDLYFEGRHEATGKGYSQPDFAKVAAAYNIPYLRVEKLEQIGTEIFDRPGPMMIDLILHPNTWIEPKLEMGRSIEDQFPYMSDDDYRRGMKFAQRPRFTPKA